MYNDKKYIIHIFDDEKFVDVAIELLDETAPQNVFNKYIVLSDKDELKFVKSREIEKVSISNLASIANIINFQFEYVFFHALTASKISILNSLNAKVKKVWLLWGYDLYTEWNVLNYNIYDSDTKKLLKYNKSFIRGIFRNFKTFSFLQKYFNGIIFKKIYASKFIDVVKKIDFFAPIVENEFKYVKSINPDIKFISFRYGYIEHFFDTTTEDNNRINILVGNSADPANNHYSVMKKLSHLDLKNRKIIVPLSYSGNKEYVDKIKEVGYELFGENFIPLEDFIPLSKYNEILSSCGHAFFNHIRQQALGNIISLAYQGVKIYLNPKSPVYHFFYKKLFVFNINKKINLDQNLTEKQTENNREVIKSYFSKQYVLKQIGTMYEIIK